MLTLNERVKNIFGFLRDLQIMRYGSQNSFENYTTNNQWFIQLDTKELDIVKVPRFNSSNSKSLESPVMEIPKLPSIPAPQLPNELRDWIDSDINSYSQELSLKNQIAKLSQNGNTETLRIENFPQIKKTFDNYENNWKIWANECKREEPIKKLYTNVFDAAQKLKNTPEEWELILSIGELNAIINPELPLKRHFFTVRCQIELNEKSGNFKIFANDPKGFETETDWLKDFSIPEKDLCETTSELLNQLDELNSQVLKDIVKKFGVQYQPEIIFERNLLPTELGKVSLTLSPILIFRKRNQRELLKALSVLSETFENGEELTSALSSILDPGSIDTSNNDIEWAEEGAVKEFTGDHDGFVYLPLPLNPEQQRVLKRADSKDLTLVQGPPGTGKTRTIAVLISHFLAQGKRVLVTAQKSQALREVKDKMPIQIQDLAVTSLGNSQKDNDEIQKSVDALTRKHDESSVISEDFRNLDRKLKELDQNHNLRAGLRRKIVDLQKLQSEPITIGDVQDSPARLAQTFFDSTAKHLWATELTSSKSTIELSRQGYEEIKTLYNTYCSHSFDIKLMVDYPDPEQVLGIRVKHKIKKCEDILRNNPPKRNITSEEALQFQIIRDLLEKFSKDVELTGRSTNKWVESALNEIKSKGKPGWIKQLETLQKRFGKNQEFIEKMGSVSEIKISDFEKLDDEFKRLLRNYKSYLKEGNEPNINKSGKLKIGIFSNKSMRDLEEFLTESRVDGKPISEVEQIDRIDALASFNIFCSDIQDTISVIKSFKFDSKKLQSRLAQVEEISNEISSILSISSAHDEIVKRLQNLSIPAINLIDSNELQKITDAIESLMAEKVKTDLQKMLMDQEKSWKSMYPIMPDLIKDFLRDLNGADEDKLLASEELFLSYCSKSRSRDKLRESIKINIKDKEFVKSLNNLIDSVNSQETLNYVNERITDLFDASSWLDLKYNLLRISSENYSNIFNNIIKIEKRNQDLMTEIAETRAWHIALKRIKPATVSAMVRYAAEVKKLGKGTGKTAPRRRREIRKLLDSCVEAIPAWIMPIQDVPKFFEPKVGSFDVLIIDEASQAGLESIFLFALAKKVVVVGDHKQVSPSAIGMSSTDIEALAKRHLKNEQLQSSYMNADRSLFEEARASFGELIRLTEHRRCVPKIIGFSNQIAYEPEGIRLIPTRQPGSAALAPIKSVFVENGYVKGTGSSQFNPVEADEVVNQVLEIIHNPETKNETIGVISLQGNTQHEYIDRKIRESIEVSEYERRKIRCGLPSDFQGSERNIIVLSSVVALGPERRYAPLTKEQDVQRFNVAVSRAMDQLILVHSIRAEDIGNKNCLRRQLIAYCTMQETDDFSGINGVVGLVSDSERDERFDSLFEQRVHNLITERGYSVIPQFTPNSSKNSYRIDLVVVGRYGRLAVECDGDAFHGEDQALADIDRQNYLESCGWSFFRITETDFYANRFKSLEPLWERLEKLGQPLQIEKMNEIESIPVQLEDEGTLIGEFEEEEDFQEDELARKQSSSIDTLVNYENRFNEHGRRISLDLYDFWEPDPNLSYIHVSNGNTKIMDEIVEIVQKEGPILKSVLARRHHRATGGSSLSNSNENLYRKMMDKAVSLGKISRYLVDDNLFRQDATIFLPGQNLFKVRELGIRDLYQVPHLELLTLIKMTVTKYNIPTNKTNEIFRIVLDSLEISRQTEKSQIYLTKLLNHLDKLPIYEKELS